MGSPLAILALPGLWLAVLVFAATHALVTGRIRVGKTGDAPIRRDDDPTGFWIAFAISIGGLAVGLVLLVVFLAAVAPEPWSRALRALGL